MPKQSAIRQQLRAQRHALPQAQRDFAAAQLLKNIAASQIFKRSKRIAFYLPTGAEMNIEPVVHLSWLHGKTCYLPVITPGFIRRLWFIPYTPGTPLIKNRFNIDEPAHQHQQRQNKLQMLDLIMLPLVGFDRSGNRIGMGAGYYDRTLATLKARKHWQRPYLLGVAYDFQEIPQIEANHWDIPLHAVVTNQEFITCTR